MQNSTFSMHCVNKDEMQWNACFEIIWCNISVSKPIRICHHLLLIRYIAVINNPACNVWQREWVNSSLTSHQKIGHTETGTRFKVSSERPLFAILLLLSFPMYISFSMLFGRKSHTQIFKPMDRKRTDCKGPVWF